MLITLDFETFYSPEYSLSKLTTEAYIRSPEFETIGVAIKIDDGPTRWYPQEHVKDALTAIDWSEAFLLAQNTAFDGAILAWHYDIHPKVLLDTLSMSRALLPQEKSHSLAAQAQRAEIGAKGDEVVHALGKRYKDFDTEALARYGRYCCNDVDLTHALFKRYLDLGFPQGELKLIDLTLRMFTRPLLRLDVALLIDHLHEVKDRKQTLIDRLRLQYDAPDEAALRTTLMSNPQFAKLLGECGVEPPMKLSATTGKLTFAFAKSDEAFTALLEHPDEHVQALVAARLGVKTTLEETRTIRFIEMAARGAFPVPLRYYGAHSGRWSGQDMVNLQNLPSRGADAGKLKRAILPPEGHVIIDCDSSQIEARTLAWLAGQDDLVVPFRNNEDVYKRMASYIYGKSVEEVSKLERQVGKTVVLGCGYGVGHKKLRTFLKVQAGVEVDDVEAKRIVDAYRRANYKIAQLWKTADTALVYLRAGMTMKLDARGVAIVTPGKGIKLPNGLYVQYPGLRQQQKDDQLAWVYDSRGVETFIYGAKVVENLTQALARCIVAEQMLRVSRKYPVVLTVHDSVACVAPVQEAAQAQAYVEECMRWVPAWANGLPLDCESGVGDSYGSC